MWLVLDWWLTNFTPEDRSGKSESLDGGGMESGTADSNGRTEEGRGWFNLLTSGTPSIVELVSWLVFWAKSTTKGYIMAKNNVQSGSHLLCTQTINKPQNQSWHKFTWNKTYTNIGHKIFEELVPSVSPLLKKHIRLGHVGIVDHSVDLSIPDFLKSITKEMDRSNKKF